MQPGKSGGITPSFTATLAFFTKTPGTWSYYAEIRQGVTFNLNDSVLITPHLVVDARYQDPLKLNSSYLEAGAGLSVKFLLLETRYEVHRASFEILAYYKHGNSLIGPSKSAGINMTASF